MNNNLIKIGKCTIIQYMEEKELFLKLNKSKFRSQFKLDEKDLNYIHIHGLLKIKQHAYDFINERIRVYNSLKDGKQTPFKGHVVFKAQHATATCCRGCIEKWHHFAKEITLNDKEVDYLVDIIMYWIEKEYLSHIK